MSSRIQFLPKKSAEWLFRYFPLNYFPVRADNSREEEAPLSEEVAKKPVSREWQEMFSK
jgi:hypothetical protein